MGVISVSMPDLIDEQIEALLRRGYYENKSEIIRDAVRLLFSSNQSLRIASAIDLYETGRISLGKAAELAGLTIEEMKDVAASQKVKFKRGPKSAKELEDEVSRLKKRMKK